MGEEHLKIGELAGQVGVATSALRYYEEAGLLEPGRRTASGYRVFGLEAIGRVRFIQRAKALGLSLEEIRLLVSRPESADESAAEALRHVVAHRIAATRARVDELERLEAELESMYTRLLRSPSPGCGHLGDCECWLPTAEEVRKMTDEVACCQQVCCPGCACIEGKACDCAECACSK